MEEEHQLDIEYRTKFNFSQISKLSLSLERQLAPFSCFNLLKRLQVNGLITWDEERERERERLNVSSRLLPRWTRIRGIPVVSRGDRKAVYVGVTTARIGVSP